jgi:uncharacterized membrane protein
MDSRDIICPIILVIALVALYCIIRVGIAGCVRDNLPHPKATFLGLMFGFGAIFAAIAGLLLLR